MLVQQGYSRADPYVNVCNSLSTLHVVRGSYGVSTDADSLVDMYILFYLLGLSPYCANASIPPV